MVTICEDVSGEDLYHDISLLKYHMRYHDSMCLVLVHIMCTVKMC